MFKKNVLTHVGSHSILPESHSFAKRELQNVKELIAMFFQNSIDI